MSRLDSHATLRPNWRHLEAVLLGIVIFAASMRLLVAYARYGGLLSGDSPLFYQAATLGFNYFEFGAVRRGLGGSMAYLLSSNLLLATVWFHLIWAALVALGLAMLYRRLDAPLATRAAFAIAAICIMSRWAEDAGRTDMAIAAIFAAATLAMRRARLDLAVALLGVGLFIHESSMIFGLPLLLALVQVQGGWDAFNRKTVRGAAILLTIAFVVYGGMGLLPHADHQFMVDTVRAKFQPHVHVDWAIYFATSGERGVRTSICQNLTDPSYFLHPLGGLVVLGVAAVTLAWNLRRGLWPMALAALPGFLFLSVVANDIARWTMMGVLNIWLVGVCVARGARGRSLPGWWCVLGAVGIGWLTHPKLNRIDYPIYAGSPAIEWVARKLHSPRTPAVAEALEQCDPDWRDVLGPRRTPSTDRGANATGLEGPPIRRPEGHAN